MIVLISQHIAVNEIYIYDKETVYNNTTINSVFGHLFNVTFFCNKVLRNARLETVAAVYINFFYMLFLILRFVFVECSSYEYGQNCLNRCSSHCYNNETCDTFFGNCSRCADGYQDAKCDKSK